MSLKVLCDENLPRAVAEWCSARGYDTVEVMRGMSDSAIASRVMKEKRILITYDSDFANILNYPPQQFSGIIRLNVYPPTVSLAITALELVFAHFKTPKSFRGKLIIAEPAGFRVWMKEK